MRSTAKTGLAVSNPSDMTARTHTYEHAARLAEDAERLSSVCSLRPFSQDEAEEAVNVLLEIPALLSDLADAREALARREWQFVHANGKLTDCADEEEALQMARVAGGWIRWRTIWQTTAVGGGGQGTQEKSRMTLPDANPSYRSAL